MENLRKGVREMVVYLLDEEAGKDADVVDGYTETFMSAFERYENDKFLTWYHSDYNNQFYLGEQLIKKYKKDTKTK